ncbi:MAG: cytochrome c oxidase subunit 3 [Actinomycetota bacterium]
MAEATAVAEHEAPETETHDGDHGDGDDHGHGSTTGISNNKLMMWVFLGSECLLFGALISTYMLYKERNEDFAANLAPFSEDGRNIGPRFGGADGHGVFDIPFTSASSFILLCSSLTMVLALSAIQRSDYYRFKIWTAATAALGATFIAGQIYEFTEFYEKGLGYSTNIFGSAFYTLTGFHGVHVSIGILMLVALLIMHRQGRLNSDKSETVEIVGLYWHFVDIVWILIFTIVYLFPQ